MRNGARHLNQVALNLPVSGWFAKYVVSRAACSAQYSSLFLSNSSPSSLFLFYVIDIQSSLWLVCRLSRLLCRRVALHQKPLVGPACTRECSFTRVGLACEDVRMRRRAAVRAPRTRYQQTTYRYKKALVHFSAPTCSHPLRFTLGRLAPAIVARAMQPIVM